MKSVLSKTERLAHSASLFAANIAAIVLLILVVLTCIDVVGRYFFSAPLTGAVELVRICMAGIIFFSFPLMFLKNDHIIVDLFAFFRRGYVGWFISLIFLGLIVYISYRLGDRVFDYAVRAWEDGDVTEYLSIPRFIVVGFITAAIFSAMLMSLLRILMLIGTPGETAEADQEGTS